MDTAPDTADRAPVSGAGTARRRIARACRELHRCGWMPGTAGNVSERFDDHVLITASGRAKGRATSGDTVAVAQDGSLLGDEAGRPSAETSIHLAVYAAVPAAHAVVHAHSPHATALATLADASAVPGRVAVGEWELAKGLGVPGPDVATTVIPVFPNWAEVPRIARDVSEWLRGQQPVSGGGPVPALLIGAHGVTTWGRDMTEAVNRLECVEALSQLVLLTGRHATSRDRERERKDAP